MKAFAVTNELGTSFAHPALNPSSPTGASAGAVMSKTLQIPYRKFDREDVLLSLMLNHRRMSRVAAYAVREGVSDSTRCKYSSSATAEIYDTYSGEKIIVKTNDLLIPDVGVFREYKGRMYFEKEKVWA